MARTKQSASREYMTFATTSQDVPEPNAAPAAPLQPEQPTPLEVAEAADLAFSALKLFEAGFLSAFDADAFVDALAGGVGKSTGDLMDVVYVLWFESQGSGSPSTAAAIGDYQPDDDEENKTK